MLRLEHQLPRLLNVRSMAVLSDWGLAWTQNSNIDGDNTPCMAFGSMVTYWARLELDWLGIMTICKSAKHQQANDIPVDADPIAKIFLFLFSFYTPRPGPVILAKNLIRQNRTFFEKYRRKEQESLERFQPKSGCCSTPDS